MLSFQNVKFLFHTLQNLLEECGKEISRFGKRAFIIAGNRAWDAVKERIIPGFEKAGLEYELHLYGGKCSYEAAREYAEKCKAENCDEVVGIGGGLVMDFAKAVGEICGYRSCQHSDINRNLCCIYNNECYVYAGRCEEGLLEIRT